MRLGQCKVGHPPHPRPGDIVVRWIGRIKPDLEVRTSASGQNRPSNRQASMSALRPIVLQKSKVASVRIFGETLKRDTIDDSDSSVALSNSPTRLGWSDEVPPTSN